MMAKKRKSDGGGRRKKRKTPSEDILEEGLPNSQLAETLLRRALGLASPATDDSPAGKAHALLNQAYAEPDASKREELARQAIQVWPDCTDAWLLLAENASTQKAALPLYEQ